MDTLRFRVQPDADRSATHTILDWSRSWNSSLSRTNPAARPRGRTTAMLTLPRTDCETLAVEPIVFTRSQFCTSETKHRASSSAVRRGFSRFFAGGRRTDSSMLGRGVRPMVLARWRLRQYLRSGKARGGSLKGGEVRSLPEPTEVRHLEKIADSPDETETSRRIPVGDHPIAYPPFGGGEFGYTEITAVRPIFAHVVFAHVAPRLHWRH